MKSTLINLLERSSVILETVDCGALANDLNTVKGQLAGKVIVDKDALRTLLLAVAASTLDEIEQLRHGRWLFPQTSPIDVLLRQLNEEG